MKIKCLHNYSLPLMLGGLALVAGCVMEPNGQLAFQPVVVAPAPVYVAPPPPPVYVAPPPVVAVEAGPVLVPDNYVWDGVEYVGVVGGNYVYLGPGNVWIVCDSVRLERFHGWERYHPDWREHAIRNDLYRHDSHGHFQPRQDQRGQPDRRRNDEQH